MHKLLDYRNKRQYIIILGLMGSMGLRVGRVPAIARFKELFILGCRGAKVLWLLRYRGCCRQVKIF
jgi:hypothetical protein